MNEGMISKDEALRLLSWYDELEPNETAEEDFLPDALLARKLMVIAGESTERQDRYILDLKGYKG